MADLRTQRIDLLKKLSASDIDWKSDDEPPASDYPNNPPSDFFVKFENVFIDLGKAVRKTQSGPRQQYFIRIVRNTTLVDLFYENEVPAPFKNLFRPIYEKATNAAVGLDDAYNFLLDKLD